MPQSTPSSKSWSSYMVDLYARRAPPPFGTVDIALIEQQAREKMKDDEHAFMYTFGSAGSGATCTANLVEMRAWKIVPRMLRDANARDLKTTLFGVEHPSPLLIAPIGVQGLLHPDGELATSRAAASLNVPFVLSTASTRSIEAVAQANGSGHRWYQIYWPKSNDVTLSLLKRAKTNGYSALVVTLDTPMLGWRPHDLKSAYLPFIHGVGSQVGLTDPVFMKQQGEQPDPVDYAPKFPYSYEEFDNAIKNGDKGAQRAHKLGLEWIGQITSGLYREWDDLKFLREHWDGPIVLKGIMDVEDAQKAIEHGMDGISVSNHGGRQIDGGIPSLYALHKICSDEKVKAAQASGKFTVLFDSGIRCGSDVIKAIALGANAVLLGRPFMYGLCVGGQEGVEAVVRNILADLEITLGLAGYKNLNELRGQGERAVVRLDQSHL
ncbi:hypothetical protein EIP91_002212 [Steccherinum ochraceum]|uniref:FMN hydroxy acid dehydrogenase domain-containing protein n=1 Tax=Steccherinum ochraceum TaxID=92696 RepID=A0A4R0RGB3_9APHY|nr:hypothetical protein EIP91_002212 [Steccherinum ochraceum]